MKLFKAIGLDVWNEKKAHNLPLSLTFKRHIGDLNQRQERLDEAFIYEKAIDREIYQRQPDQLNEQIVPAQRQKRNA